MRSAPRQCFSFPGKDSSMQAQKIRCKDILYSFDNKLEQLITDELGRGGGGVAGGGAGG